MTRPRGTIWITVALLVALQVLVAGGSLLWIEIIFVGVLFAIGALRTGARARPADLIRASLLMLPLAMFELGLLWLVLLPLSYWAPEVVEGVFLRVEQPYLWHRPGESVVVNVIAAVVLTPVFEEGIFRGWLLPACRRRWGVRPAIVLTSVVFGALHEARMLGATIFGLVAALLYLRSGSLAVPIVAHVTMNAIGVSGDLLLSSETDSVTGAEVMEELRAAWWIGAIGLIAGGPIVVRFVRESWARVTGDDQRAPEDAAIGRSGAA